MIATHSSNRKACRWIPTFALALIIFGAQQHRLMCQEVEASGSSSGAALFSPVNFLEFSVPVAGRVTLSNYGFYLSNLRASIGLTECAVAIDKHLTITPSYLYFEIPKSGFDAVTGSTGTSDYREHQFRLAVTTSWKWHKIIIADRNMYVRRMPDSAQDLNRYRQRIYVGRTLPFQRFSPNAFAMEEIYHDFASGPWLRRSWLASGLEFPVSPAMTLQTSYIRQDDSELRSVNFLGMGIIIRTTQLFERSQHRKDD